MPAGQASPPGGCWLKADSQTHARRFSDPAQGLSRRLSAAAFEPGDDGLGGLHAGGELLLRQGRPGAGLDQCGGDLELRLQFGVRFTVVRLPRGLVFLGQSFYDW